VDPSPGFSTALLYCIAVHLSFPSLGSGWIAKFVGDASLAAKEALTDATTTLFTEIRRLEAELACSLFYRGRNQNEWLETWERIQDAEGKLEILSNQTMERNEREVAVLQFS
jgi:hypothetical protein